MRVILPFYAALVVAASLSQAIGVESVKSDASKKKSPELAPSGSSLADPKVGRNNIPFYGIRNRGGQLRRPFL